MTDDRASSHDLLVSSDLAEVRRVQDLVEAALQANRFGESDQFAVKLAVEEALVNAIKHGNQLDPAKSVRVRYSVDDEQFRIHITDEGPGFNPDDLPDPTADDFLERPCGRGVLLIRSFMTTVDFLGCGNEVVMSKIKTPPDADQ
ncbi:MAG: ATP-binding protein [Fimbriiglobus sp.]|jgi:serine/threonine-protein kinase RsbW|nr:ATP-binding protein [Fimbriiglobus sp.]